MAYYDLIPRIKNACQAGKTSLTAPFSKMDFSVAKALVEAGYIKEVQKRSSGKKDFLDIKISKKSVINGMKLISKPSRHIYVPLNGIKRVRNGYGIGIFSTSRGIMSDKEARKN